MMKGVKMQDKGAIKELRQLAKSIPGLQREFHQEVADVELAGAKSRFNKNILGKGGTGRLGASFRVNRVDEEGVEIEMGRGIPYAALWSFGGRYGRGGVRERKKQGRDLWAAWPAARRKARDKAEQLAEKWGEGRL